MGQEQYSSSSNYPTPPLAPQGMSGSSTVLPDALASLPEEQKVSCFPFSVPWFFNTNLTSFGAVVLTWHFEI